LPQFIAALAWSTGPTGRMVLRRAGSVNRAGPAVKQTVYLLAVPRRCSIAEKP